MNRLFTKNSTGIGTDGHWYAGDINAIEDAVAALTDLTQPLSVGSLAVGEAGLQVSRYGAGEFRLSGAVRTDGVTRALGGLFAGTFTTAARDSIPAGATPQQRPYGLVILNTTTNRLEWNSGTDAAPSWRSVASDGAGNLSVATQVYAGSNLGAGGAAGARGALQLARSDGAFVGIIKIQTDDSGLIYSMGGGGSYHRWATNSLANAMNLSDAGDLTVPTLHASSAVVANNGASSQIILGASAGTATIYFGSAADVNLYRAGVSNLQTAGAFVSAFWLGTGPVNVGHSLPGLALGSTGGVTGATSADHAFLFWDGTNLKFRKPSNGATSILV